MLLFVLMVHQLICRTFSMYLRQAFVCVNTYNVYIIANENSCFHQSVKIVITVKMLFDIFYEMSKVISRLKMVDQP